MRSPTLWLLAVWRNLELHGAMCMLRTCGAVQDYLVVGFRPSQTKEILHDIVEGSSLEEAAADVQSIPVPTASPSPQGLSALAPDDTYFVVFRYGAVVLFQGRRRLPELDTCKHVVAPKHGPYAVGPWETDMQVWAEASGKDKEDADRHLIYLLLRPFMSKTSSTSLPVRIPPIHICPRPSAALLTSIHVSAAADAKVYCDFEFACENPGCSVSETVRCRSTTSEQCETVFSI